MTKAWQPGPLKRWLLINESGAWGSDPLGEADTPVVRSTDIRVDGTWDLSEVALRQLSAEERSGKRLLPGDLVVVKSSGSATHLGKSAIVDERVAALGAAFSNFVQRLRPRRSASPRYLWYFLASRTAAAEMEMLGSTTTGLRNLSGGLIGSVTFPGPPLSAQRAIADYLDHETARIDALSAKKQELKGRLLERRTALTYAAVRGGSGVDRAPIKKSQIPWSPSIPKHWREAPLTLVARLGSGHTPSRERPEWWTDCRIPWVTTGEVAQMRSDRIELISETRENISELGLANSAAELHPMGTVVLSRTASAGFSAIMGRDMATSQDFVTWTCGPLLEPRFLLLCLRAMRADLLDRLAQGSTHKTIYMPDIKSIRVPLPPVDEQRAIVVRTWDGLRRIDRTVERLEQQVELLREHRQALITAAVTGELEIPGVA